MNAAVFAATIPAAGGDAAAVDGDIPGISTDTIAAGVSLIVAAGDIQRAFAVYGEAATGRDSYTAVSIVRPGDGIRADQLDCQIAITSDDEVVIELLFWHTFICNLGILQGQGGAIPHDVVIIFGSAFCYNGAVLVCGGVGGGTLAAHELHAAHGDGGTTRGVFRGAPSLPSPRRQRARREQGQGQAQGQQRGKDPLSHSLIPPFVVVPLAASFGPAGAGRASFHAPCPGGSVPHCYPTTKQGFCHHPFPGEKWAMPAGANLRAWRETGEVTAA